MYRQYWGWMDQAVGFLPTQSRTPPRRRASFCNEQLAEAFAYLGLTVFTGYFLNYAQTDADV
jgi:hypothetical protein